MRDFLLLEVVADRRGKRCLPDLAEAADHRDTGRWKTAICGGIDCFEACGHPRRTDAGEQAASQTITRFGGRNSSLEEDALDRDFASDRRRFVPRCPGSARRKTASRMIAIARSRRRSEEMRAAASRTASTFAAASSESFRRRPTSRSKAQAVTVFGVIGRPWEANLLPTTASRCLRSCRPESPLVRAGGRCRRARGRGGRSR